MELDFTLSPHEAGIVLMWSEKTMSGGHWGDGDAIFPDEWHVLERIKKIKKGEPAKFTARDVEIILIFMENHCGCHFSAGLSLTAEEEQLARKLKAAIPESKS